jgi:hypothetical protein
MDLVRQISILDRVLDGHAAELGDDFTAYRNHTWVDVSKGLIRFGLSRQQINDVLAMWPDAGFRKRLVVLGLHRFRTHPWNPLPMIKL